MIYSAIPFACLVLAAPQQPQLVDISNDFDAPEARQSLLVRADDVLLIEARSGQRAVVQFTRVGSDHAAYRWRYRRSPRGELLSGVGKVAEKFERIREGDRVRVLPLPGHDTTIRAGDIRVEWSLHDPVSGFIYYHPKRATVSILPPESFERNP